VSKAILIAGPTASGKSALALAVAEARGGIVINADSMQVYRDLHVITARPAAAETARVPHALYGHVDGAEAYSVGRWLADAQMILAQAERDGRPPIIVGGTGLYFKALTQGLTLVPPISPLVRESVRARLAAEGAPALHADLARRDPAAAARLNPGDSTRVARALEVIEATGRSILDWHGEATAPLVDPASTLKVFLAPERRDLARRIDARFDAMVEAGALHEVRVLTTRGLGSRMPVMKAHGVPWLIRHLRGEISLAEAVSQAQSDTRRYAKRQLTWFRHQLPDWSWLTPDGARGALLRGRGF
jgi:tRNA dimethylallyltransferase